MSVTGALFHNAAGKPRAMPQTDAFPMCIFLEPTLMFGSRQLKHPFM
jgi:hypothetical protein